MADSILFEEREGGIRIITLNRPDALNAITCAMAERLFALLDQCGADEAARCIIITGAGDCAFSAGFDIREMADFNGDQMQAAFVARDPLSLCLAEHPLPVIVALNGPALGAGALMAAAADFRVATPDASFRVTAIGYGSANASWSLPRLVGVARAKDILMTGRTIAAEEGLAIGLFDRLADDALAGALDLAGEIIRHPASGVADVKRLVDTAPALTPRQGWQAEHEAILTGFARQGLGGDAVFSGFLGKKGSDAAG